MELRVEKGVGYIPAAQKLKEEKPVETQEEPEPKDQEEKHIE